MHKRRLSLDESQGLSLDGIHRLAENPQPFDVPIAPTVCEQARADWLGAAQIVTQGEKVKAQRTGKPTLNRQTLAFMRDGAGEGDRHRLLYSAARNLGEFGCPPALAHALLDESALDSGLAPKEVNRQIECGLKDQGPLADAAPPMPSALPVANVADMQTQLAALWQRPAAPDLETDKAEGDGHGDAWEHPQDALGVVDPAALSFPFGANESGPYGKEGGGR